MLNTLLLVVALQASTPDGTATAAPAASTWTVQGNGKETRVINSMGVPVTVGQGLATIGEAGRLEDRARKAADTRLRIPALVGWGLAVVTPLVMGAGSLGSVLLGSAFWAYAAVGNLEPLTPYVDGVVLAGPMFVLAGVLGLLVWTLVFAGVVAAAIYHFAIPPGVDPATVAALAGSTTWDEAEAREVVTRRNAAHAR